MLPPNPSVLNWLVRGQLSSSLHRAIRLWVIINSLYGENDWSGKMPDPWNYPDFRSQLFLDSHPHQDQMSAKVIASSCVDISCLCHKSCREIINLSTSDHEQLITLTNLTKPKLDKLLDSNPFLTVHRSIRADLKVLVELGWLRFLDSGHYRCPNPKSLPKFSEQINTLALTPLSNRQQVELIRALETLALIQPNLHIVLDPISAQLQPTDNPNSADQRVFIEIDYILNDATQEQVDDIQAEIEELWHQAEGGVIQFDYNLDSNTKSVEVIVYPVCIHYIRRAKYLSAYGKDIEGNIQWHNYRLDRIIPNTLKVLVWGDPTVPPQLKTMRNQGTLPTPQYVREQLESAWGFKFYSPATLAILRFSSDFADRFIRETFRHHTFQEVSYKQLQSLLRKQINDPLELTTILNILKNRSPTDAYFKIQIREDDINIIQRMRSWRPNGEVIAPLSLRKRMQDEALLELNHYH